MEDSSGSVIALIKAWGSGLDQDMWLDAADARKRGITSSAGGIKLVEIHDPKKLEEMLKQLAMGKSVGILSVWPDKAKKPLQFVIKKGQSLSIPEFDCSLKILDYMPHYSIDAKTRKARNVSKQPVNPAIKVRCTKGDSTTEQWLWSRFPSSPHSKAKLPFRSEFTAFDFGKKAGRYILAGAADSELWIMFFKDGKVVAEKARTGKDYPLSDAKYAVAIKEYYGSGIIKDEWKNGDESLVRPAIIATVQKGQKEKEMVLEMGKRGRYSDDDEAITLLFGRKANPKMKGRGKGEPVK
ncbi:MAG: hypothetical protein DRP66_07180 [Planctomycetota bacterium]|nr:MAG: hypothetical protein DRP66_07180 [Planctomycetota bacterium]